MDGPGSPTGSLTFRWDPKNLEIRTKSVEQTLEPLVIQVTTLVSTSQKGPSKNKKGRSKKAHVLAAAVQKATEGFIIQGETIAQEYPEVTNEMLAAVNDVKRTGDDMAITSKDFADDPCSTAKRGAMVRSARALLSAVTRLLIIADMVDVHLLLRSLQLVEDDLARLRNAGNAQEVTDSYRNFGLSVGQLSHLAGRRQADLRDVRHRDDLAAARATLKKNSVMLLTTSKTYVRHPELDAARSNRDYVMHEVSDAVHTISGIAQATGDSLPNQYERVGELAAALAELDQQVNMDPRAYTEHSVRPTLEQLLENIIAEAARMADSPSTRDERRERIVQECTAVRQALKNLLDEYMRNTRHDGSPENLDRALNDMFRRTRDLSRQLRKAVVDHVSDSFLETNVPLEDLYQAAKAGDMPAVDMAAPNFEEHANKLVEVADLACSMSSNEDGVKMVRMAADQIKGLCPEVINAARVLAARPRSKVALENMDVFKDAWERQVQLLTEAVDDITTIDDFLAVSESHILEDVNKCVLALQEGDTDMLDRTAGAIRGRCQRVCNVVLAEMEKYTHYEHSVYTDRVLDSVRVLRDQVMVDFVGRVNQALDALQAHPAYEVDENDFIDVCRLVYDGVRDIRRAVLMNRRPEDIEDDSDVEYIEEGADEYQKYAREYDQYNYDPEGIYSNYAERLDMDQYQEGSDRTLMRHLPAEEKEKIKEQVEMFREERVKFDREVAKWDDSGNDIIVISKLMCMIMMEMTDFTRGRGPLTTTMDVIGAAKKISEAGSNLTKLCKQIAEVCPDSRSKQDLEVYLERINLYCHQLNITSKVKADVQHISGELIISGLDSATSLIQAARNLMSSVVQAVKAAYVASTKYRKEMGAQNPYVRWRMKAPEKKPLIAKESADTSFPLKIVKSTKQKKVEPIKTLSEFSSEQETYA